MALRMQLWDVVDRPLDYDTSMSHFVFKARELRFGALRRPCGPPRGSIRVDAAPITKTCVLNCAVQIWTGLAERPLSTAANRPARSDPRTTAAAALTDRQISGHHSRRFEI